MHGVLRPMWSRWLILLPQICVLASRFSSGVENPVQGSQCCWKGSASVLGATLL